MNGLLLFEQALNGLQFGLMLFLLAAGLTLVFGIMDLIHLSHGSLYMLGAYIAASVAGASGSFWIAVVVALVATAAVGALLEYTVLRHLYTRDHLSQVLATFALLMIFNDAVRMVWGPQPVTLNPPAYLAGSVNLLGLLPYPAFRLVIIATGLLVAAGLYFLLAKTRLGMLIRAGASNREMASVMGANIRLLFTWVFALGASLCALAACMLGPLLAVQIGMGESILIMAFVVVVIGGIGSIRGALVGAILVGVVDTAGRAYLPQVLREFLPLPIASNLGPALASISIYVLMALVLFFKPTGLFPARG